MLVNVSFPKGSAVSMDKTVAHLIQLKLQAKALEATLQERCYSVIYSRTSNSQSSTTASDTPTASDTKAASDIKDAQRQCQEVLLALVHNEGPREKEPVDPQDL